MDSIPYRILSNKIQCLKCGKILESLHVHDYRECKCGVSVDGGNLYLKRGWPDGEPRKWYKELSKTEE